MSGRSAPALVAPDLVQTPRLEGRRITPEHLEAMRRLHRDPDVAATLGGVRPEAWIRTALDRHVRRWDELGFDFWVFAERESREFVGVGGLQGVEIDGSHETEIACALLPGWWGRGLATEIAQTSLRVAFETLGLEEVIAFTLPTNAASRRAMEKAGLAYERDGMHAGLPHVFYRSVQRAR